MFNCTPRKKSTGRDNYRVQFQLYGKELQLLGEMWKKSIRKLKQMGEAVTAEVVISREKHTRSHTMWLNLDPLWWRSARVRHHYILSVKRPTILYAVVRVPAYIIIIDTRFVDRGVRMLSGTHARANTYIIVGI